MARSSPLTPEDKARVQQALHELLKDRGTQGQLAADLGLSQQQVSAALQGRSIGFKVALNAARLRGQELGAMLSGEPAPTPSRASSTQRTLEPDPLFLSAALDCERNPLDSVAIAVELALLRAGAAGEEVCAAAGVPPLFLDKLVCSIMGWRRAGDLSAAERETLGAIAAKLSLPAEYFSLRWPDVATVDAPALHPPDAGDSDWGEAFARYAARRRRSLWRSLTVALQLARPTYQSLRQDEHWRPDRTERLVSWVAQRMLIADQGLAEVGVFAAEVSMGGRRRTFAPETIFGIAARRAQEQELLDAYASDPAFRAVVDEALRKRQPEK